MYIMSDLGNSTQPSCLQFNGAAITLIIVLYIPI